MRAREWLGWGWLYSLMNGLTADTSPDHTADHVITRDNSTGKPAKVLLQYVGIGKQTVWVPAAAMTPRTTNGPSLGTTESTTNDVMNKMLDFDQTTAEGAQFAVAMPNSWDEGTVTFIPYWTAASGTGNVEFTLAGVAVSNDDVIDSAFGTAIGSIDTVIATTDVHVGPESTAVTIAGTPAAGDLVYFEVERNTATASNLAADARLIGIKLFYTTNINNDT